jgi:hypothetical protein
MAVHRGDQRVGQGLALGSARRSVPEQSGDDGRSEPRTRAMRSHAFDRDVNEAAGLRCQGAPT